MPAFVLYGNSLLNQTKTSNIGMFLLFFAIFEMVRRGPVAQLVEHRPFKAIAASSSLARLTTI
jgi:hypothetical protein